MRVRGTARAAEAIVEGALVALGGRPARVIVLQDCSSVGAIALWDQPLREQLLGAMDLTSLAALSAARSSLSRVADWIYWAPRTIWKSFVFGLFGTPLLY